MSKQLLIIKLGGSVVTDKDKQVPTPRLNVIKNLAKQINEIYSKNKYQIILVHGAGSFGHPIAKKYNLHKGMGTKEQALGFSLIQLSMMKLNTIITNALTNYSIPAISLYPHCFIQQTGGKLNDFDYQSIKKILKQNLVPVLYGDAVLDDKWGSSILSGDTIVSYLAKKLKTKKVIFLSDVDGIFDKDPKKNSNARLIKEINNKNLNQILKSLTPNGRDDVTGEMKGKVIQIKKDLAGINITISNGLKSGVLLKAAENDDIGTKLLVL